MSPRTKSKEIKAERSGRHIEYMPLAGLKGATRNPKKHADAILASSIGRFGYTEPILLDERTGRLVAGHGRMQSLRAMRIGGKDIPEGVQVGPDGEWLVPVIRGWASRSDTEADAYLLASNRLTEAGGWDDGALLEMLKELDAAQALDGVGFSPDDIDALISQLNVREEGLTDPDEVPEVPTESNRTKLGDLWELGDHRLMCGDSTDAEAVRKLMAGERAGLMNTDPPYGVSYENDDRPNPGVAKPRVAKPRVANDALSDSALQEFLERAFRAAKGEALIENAAWYLWHAHLTQGFFAAAAAAAAANVVLHRQIIWVKPVLLLGRGQYHWKHEPCFMGWVEGNRPPDYGEGAGERTQTTVWEVAGVTQAERKEFNHSTPKPVRLFEVPIIKHLRAGEIAYEPFSGSGPQLIAAQQSGRRCFAMELAPVYVHAAIERWEKFTGKTATLLERA